MSTARSLLPPGRYLHVADALAVVWVVVWAALGIAIAQEVRGLRQLSATTVKVGVAMEQTGRSMETLSSVPFVGGELDDAARRTMEAGRSTIESGRSSRDSVENLSWMLGVLLAVIPTVPLLGLYVPLRVAAAREQRALAHLLRTRGDDPVVRRLLAQRAVLTLPYRRIAEFGSDDLGDAKPRHLDALVEEELERLGVDGSPGR